MSIEEDIEILNKLVTTKFNNDYSIDNIDKEATEHLLTDYTRQKQINKEHQKINGELREQVKELEEENRMFKNNKVLVSRYFKLKDNSIPKQKIKDKIEELDEEIQEYIEYWKKYPRQFKKETCINYHKKIALQELLQESEGNNANKL